MAGGARGEWLASTRPLPREKISPRPHRQRDLLHTKLKKCCRDSLRLCATAGSGSTSVEAATCTITVVLDRSLGYGADGAHLLPRDAHLLWWYRDPVSGCEKT